MKSLASKKCLIILNGQFSKRLVSLFTRRSKENKFTIISADGASNSLMKMGVLPGYIVGDLDSMTARTSAYFRRKNVVIKKIYDQDLSDFEKCIRFALKRKLNDIFVIGYAGKRADHTLSNFSILKRYHRRCRIRFIDEEFEAFFTSKTEEFSYRKGETVSILGLPAAGGIKTYGLKYPLKNEQLVFGKREGALNISTSDIVRIELKKGELLVFRKHFGKVD